MLPGEQVQVVNLNNGQRFVTYTIAGDRDSGIIELNGPAARLGTVGDKIIIVAYGLADDAEATALQPKIVHVNEENTPTD